MTLLDPPVEQAHKSRAMIITTVALVLVAAVVLWFTFRYYPEKKAASQFFETLVAGDTNKAYELWKASSNYQMKDFLADWGSEGYYGPVKSFKIMSAKTPRKSDTSIEVNVAISPYSPFPDASDADKSRKTKTVPIWVSKSDKALSFPVPY
jgi:hypothetical protein